MHSRILFGHKDNEVMSFGVKGQCYRTFYQMRKVKHTDPPYILMCGNLELQRFFTYFTCKVCVTCVGETGHARMMGAREDLNPLELKLQVIVRHPTERGAGIQTLQDQYTFSTDESSLQTLGDLNVECVYWSLEECIGKSPKGYGTMTLKLSIKTLKHTHTSKF